MKIAHVAIWTKNLEAMKDFYCNYFNGNCNQKYINPVKGFESYFVSFEGNTKLELMRSKSVAGQPVPDKQLGITHFAFEMGSKEQVVALTEKMRSDGITIVSEPRTTGDGYFESSVLDIEGNTLEIIA